MPLTSILEPGRPRWADKIRRGFRDPDVVVAALVAPLVVGWIRADPQPQATAPITAIIEATLSPPLPTRRERFGNEVECAVDAIMRYEAYRLS
jgi:hypothetical protein